MSVDETADRMARETAAAWDREGITPAERERRLRAFESAVAAPRTKPLHQYVVLHQSLRKVPGAACAQTVHAATESLRRLPVDTDTHAAILVAENSEQLEQLSDALRLAGIHHALIHEPDAPYNGTAVALGVEPRIKATVAPFMVDFKPFR